jgi:hypothetical protein
MQSLIHGILGHFKNILPILAIVALVVVSLHLYQPLKAHNVTTDTVFPHISTSRTIGSLLKIFALLSPKQQQDFLYLVYVFNPELRKIYRVLGVEDC